MIRFTLGRAGPMQTLITIIFKTNSLFCDFFTWPLGIRLRYEKTNGMQIPFKWNFFNELKKVTLWRDEIKRNVKCWRQDHPRVSFGSDVWYVVTWIRRTWLRIEENAGSARVPSCIAELNALKRARSKLVIKRPAASHTKSLRFYYILLWGRRLMGKKRIFARGFIDVATNGCNFLNMEVAEWSWNCITLPLLQQ